MMRSALLPLAICLLLSGCGASTCEPAPFDGYWRRYDDENGAFVEFRKGRITLGDKSVSESGEFRFESVGDDEPLYQVRAEFPNGPVSFQVYYESDTIELISDDDSIGGLYEIIVELVPNER
ncbi:MAG: hypothetical protein KDA85_09895 [Planctomycetaceae bacterium]|nr:hypothetical protein [Planctomycetaceae bacterium]